MVVVVVSVVVVMVVGVIGNGRCHTLLKATLEIDPMRNYFHSETKGAPP